jgi:xanthine dehydrogenase YagS FAD-binding subunit
MKSFEYAAPKTLEEATALLADQWGQTEVLAGGTDLDTALKQNITAPERVVSLKNIWALKGVRKEDQGIRIGAMTPLAELVEHSDINRHFPALVTAVKEIGSLQILSAGTAGGDLCQRNRCWYFRMGYGMFGQKDGESLVVKGDNRYHAVFGNDGPAYFVSPSSLGPPLIALGAKVTAVGPGDSSREIPVSDLFQIPRQENQRETVLKPNEILSSIYIPIQGLKNATYEVRHRHGFDWPFVTASVAFQSQGDNISQAQVVLGHVAPKPWTASKAAQSLNGSRMSQDLAVQCGKTAAQGANPLSHNGYKVQLVKSAVRRALLAAAGMQSEV